MRKKILAIVFAAALALGLAVPALAAGRPANVPGDVTPDNTPAVGADVAAARTFDPGANPPKGHP